MKDRFADLIHPDDPDQEVVLEQFEDGSKITASWETVATKIAENPTEGKWAEYIARWRSEGRID